MKFEGLLTNSPALQGLQVAGDTGKGTTQGIGWMNLVLTHLYTVYCLYNLEQVLISQSLFPHLLNGNIVYLTWWW